MHRRVLASLLIVAFAAAADRAAAAPIDAVGISDDPPALSIDDASVGEGDSGSRNATFTVSLSTASATTVTVEATAASGTATAPADYVNTGTAIVTFAPGQTSQRVQVLVKGDRWDEADETFTVKLDNATGATITDATGLGTIIDDDPPPALSINDIAVVEGDAGTRNATFTVSLDLESGKTVTVDAAAADGTAVAPGDYAAVAPTTLTFTPNQASRTVTVPVVGDTVDEAVETFTVTLSGERNATIARATGTATILDNDAPPTVSIDDVSVGEGDSATTSATFTVSLDHPSSNTVTVAAASAGGTAVAPDDYAALASTTVTFSPGQTSKTVDVAVKGDTLDETDETFTVLLSGASNATIANDTGTGTITNDDVRPSLSIDDVPVAEGANATFTVSLDRASGKSVTVDVASANGTAIAPGDYTALAATTLTFSPGQTSKMIGVPVTDDTLDETDETFTVVLSDPVNATIADSTGTGTIVNDDRAAPRVVPVVRVGNATVNPEGNSGTTPATFAVRLSRAATAPVTVRYATASRTAAQAADYTATNGSLTFAAGQTAKTVVVHVKGDLLKEPNETFKLRLSNLHGATLGTAEGTGTIVDDDVAPPFITMPGSIGRTKLLCGLRQHGKCRRLAWSGTFPGKGRAVWTVTAYDPQPGGRPEELRLRSFDQGVEQAATVKTTLRATRKLLKKASKGRYRSLRITLEFTMPDGRSYVVEDTLALTGA